MNIRVVQKGDIVYKNGCSPLFIRFTHERKSKFVSLGISLLPDHWDKQQQMIRQSCPESAILQQRIESLGKYNSASKVKTVFSLIGQFRNADIRLEEIDLVYLNDLELFLRKRGNKDNSIATKFSVFKAIYNKALAEELFAPKVNPFVKFKTGRLWTATRKRAITKEELRRIIGYSGLFESASSLYCGNPIGKCSPRVTR